MQKYHIKGKTMELRDQIAIRKQLRPMWVFRDFLEGKHLPDKHLYWCFIGCNYPDGLQLENEEKYKKALEFITSGKFLTWQQQCYPGRAIGVASGATPGSAFQAAVYQSGIMRPKTEKKDEKNSEEGKKS